MRLRTRMLLSVLGTVIAILASILLLIGIQTYYLSENSADRLAEAQAENLAAKVQAELDVAMNAARTMAQTLEGMKTQGRMDRAESEHIHGNTKQQTTMYSTI